MTRRISQTESVRQNILANYRFAYTREYGGTCPLSDEALERIIVEMETFETSAEQDAAVLAAMLNAPPSETPSPTSAPSEASSTAPGGDTPVERLDPPFSFLILAQAFAKWAKDDCLDTHEHHLENAIAWMHNEKVHENDYAAFIHLVRYVWAGAV